MQAYRKYSLIFLIFALIGIVDAAYLSYEHYSGIIPPCSTNLLFLDCGKVLTSSYSVILGLPLALLGLFHYIVLVCNIIFNDLQKYKFSKLLILQIGVGFLFSIYLISLQLFVIHAFCFYCMISAVNSIILFIIALSSWRNVVTIGSQK